MRSVEIADLERIVLTVEEEHERLRGLRALSKLPGLQRAAFLLLQVVAYSIPIALGLLLFGIFLLGWGGSIQALLLLAWIAVAVILLLPLTLLLNLPLIVTAWRQRRAIVSRGLLVPAFPSWQRWARWAVLALTAMAAVLAITVDAFGWAGFLLVFVGVIFPFLLIMMRSFLGLASRNLDLLKEIKTLQVVLKEKLDEARRESRTEIELPHEIAVRLSDATEGIFRNQRLRAIDHSMRAPSSDYSISQSATFRERLNGFEDLARLQVLDKMHELGANRKPQGTRHDEVSGHWIWPLGALEIDLVYEIADEDKQVLVRDARPSQGAPST